MNPDEKWLLRKVGWFIVLALVLAAMTYSPPV